MENNIHNKSALEVIQMVKAHVERDSDYTAMTLVNDIENSNITNKPWEEPDKALVTKYVNSEIVEVLEKAGFKFEFYPYRTHEVEKDGVKKEVTDTWALALTWYRWTRLNDIFRQFKV